MSDMKCPFCQQDLCKFGKIEKDHTRTIQGAYCPHCKIKDSDIKLWQELIRTKELLDIECAEHEMCHTQMLKTTEKLERTRKALELAITGLKNCKTRDHIGAVCRTPEYVDKILEQITALEQKDK